MHYVPRRISSCSTAPTGTTSGWGGRAGSLAGSEGLKGWGGGNGERRKGSIKSQKYMIDTNHDFPGSTLWQILTCHPNWVAWKYIVTVKQKFNLPHHKTDYFSALHETRRIFWYLSVNDDCTLYSTGWDRRAQSRCWAVLTLTWGVPSYLFLLLGQVGILQSGLARNLVQHPNESQLSSGSPSPASAPLQCTTSPVLRTTPFQCRALGGRGELIFLLACADCGWIGFSTLFASLKCSNKQGARASSAKFEVRG